MKDELISIIKAHGFSYIDEINSEDIDPAFIERIPLSFAKGNLVIPLRKENGKVLVALADPKGIFALNDVEKFLFNPVTPVFTRQESILNTIHRFYDRLSGSAQEVIDGISSESLDTLATEWEEPKDLLELVDEAPIIKLLNSLLFQAVKERASDIHIEPYEKVVEVRFRVDGVLFPVLSPPKAIQEATISRVKVMAGLDIAEKRLPQDGRIRLLIAGKDIDVRVSVIPTSFGERVVLRLLDRKGGIIEFERLGLNSQQVEIMDSLLSRNSGIILVTGPTGSGKTTTLYSALNRINSAKRNIITVEDPVEYQLKGIGQLNVNPKIGLTFANGLRSILRQDPDIIMVGEIRDMETAEIAIHASLTGHLVISTLHTNDAPTAITRLVDMGIERFLVASSLSAVVAQRLVRVLCQYCKEEYIPQTGEISAFKQYSVRKLWKPVGCERCFKSGYHGRTGIFEFLIADQDMHSVILKNPDSSSLKGYALSKGMKTLKNDGLEKAAAGITSLEEIIRVTQIN
ncbi:MAG TPA: type II secretion system ATPase GspE [Nitrospinota bacterium]|nr:type II secretion system ATPase GspE [Nitrospinota bacterium]